MKTEKKVTASIELISHNVLVLDKSTNETITKVYCTEKCKPEKALKKIQHMNRDKNLLPLYILSSTSTACKYAMPESKFIALSAILEKRPTDSRYITRNCTTLICTALVINKETHDTHNDVFEIGNAKTDSDALYFINNRLSGTVYQALYILSKEEKTILRGMPETDFVRHGAIVTE